MWNETRSRNETGIQRKTQGFATVRLSATDFRGKRDTDRKKSFRKGKPSQHASPLTVQQGMLVITGIHLSVPFIEQGIANLGMRVRSSIRKRLGGRTKRNEIIL